MEIWPMVALASSWIASAGSPAGPFALDLASLWLPSTILGLGCYIAGLALINLAHDRMASD